MNPEAALQENARLSHLVSNLITALRVSDDPRYGEVLDVLVRAKIEEAPLNPGLTDKEMYVHTNVLQKVTKYVNTQHPGLLALANMDAQEYYHA